MEGRQGKRMTQRKNNIRQKKKRHNIRSARGQMGRKMAFSKSQGSTD